MNLGFMLQGMHYEIRFIEFIDSNVGEIKLLQLLTQCFDKNTIQYRNKHKNNI